MREIILDTETTGLRPGEGHKIIEIAAIEIVDFIPTGNTYHQYINPERDVPQTSTDVHGITSKFLYDKPTFNKIADEFLQAATHAPQPIHVAESNASSALSLKIGVALASGAPPVLTEI